MFLKVGEVGTFGGWVGPGPTGSDPGVAPESFRSDPGVASDYLSREWLSAPYVVAFTSMRVAVFTPMSSLYETVTSAPDFPERPSTVPSAPAIVVWSL